MNSIVPYRAQDFVTQNTAVTGAHHHHRPPVHAGYHRHIIPSSSDCSIEINVEDFDHRDLSVQVYGDNKLVIHANRYYMSIDSDNYLKKELLRTFLLPGGINRDHITSSLTRDGLLRINVPMSTSMEQTGMVVNGANFRPVSHIQYHERALRSPNQHNNRQISSHQLIPYRYGHKYNSAGIHPGVVPNGQLALPAPPVTSRTTSQTAEKSFTRETSESRAFDAVQPSNSWSLRRQSQKGSIKPSANSDLAVVNCQQQDPVVPINHDKTEKSYTIDKFLRSPLKPHYSKKRKMITIRMKMSGHSADGISIKVVDKLLDVSSTKTKLVTNGVWHKEMALPDGVDTGSITSYFTNNSVLVIEIPVIA